MVIDPKWSKMAIKELNMSGHVYLHDVLASQRIIIDLSSGTPMTWHILWLGNSMHDVLIKFVF